MKLLIADDDRVLTHLLSARLRAKGWTVTIALHFILIQLTGTSPAPA